MEIVEENKNQYFENFKKFLQTDMKVKELLLKLAPTSIDTYDEESKLEYLDKTYEMMKYFKTKFVDVSEKFDFEKGTQEAIQEFFSKNLDNIISAYSNKESIEKLYKKYFSDMNPDLVESTKRECKGHLLIRDVEGLIKNARSVNELLHIVHSYIINNEEILRAMPIVNQKLNYNEQNITLYGTETELSKEIFDKIPDNLSPGDIDIVSTEDKILMMVRDVGHALTIDMDIDKENDVLVKYFIPKICNRDMVEELPGINKGTITDNGGNGVFQTRVEDLSEAVFDFIGRVPTDDDIYREGGPMYEHTIVQLVKNAYVQENFREEDFRKLVKKILTEEKML